MGDGCTQPSRLYHPLMKNRRFGNFAVTACVLLMALHQTARADALWYGLESGSQLDLINGGVTVLHGQLAVLGCGKTGAEQNPKRDYFSIHALRLDETPEDLEHRLKDGSQIPLFGGPGVSLSGRYGSLHARSDGGVSDFKWNLRHALDWERSDEAALRTRRITNDQSQTSKLNFAHPEDPCPESIELHLEIEDATTLFEVDERESPSGEWMRTPKPFDQSRELIGRLTIYARAIPGSEETVREPGRARQIPLQVAPPRELKRAEPRTIELDALEQ
jgi:hypothetical protein